MCAAKLYRFKSKKTKTQKLKYLESVKQEAQLSPRDRARALSVEIW